MTLVRIQERAQQCRWGRWRNVHVAIGSLGVTWPSGSFGHSGHKSHWATGVTWRVTWPLGSPGGRRGQVNSVAKWLKWLSDPSDPSAQVTQWPNDRRCDRESRASRVVVRESMKGECWAPPSDVWSNGRGALKQGLLFFVWKDYIWMDLDVVFQGWVVACGFCFRFGWRCRVLVFFFDFCVYYYVVKFRRILKSR